MQLCCRLLQRFCVLPHFRSLSCCHVPLLAFFELCAAVRLGQEAEDKRLRGMRIQLRLLLGGVAAVCGPNKPRIPRRRQRYSQNDRYGRQLDPSRARLQGETE